MLIKPLKDSRVFTINNDLLCRFYSITSLGILLLGNDAWSSGAIFKHFVSIPIEEGGLKWTGCAWTKRNK